MATITLSNGLPTYDWLALLTAAFTLGNDGGNLLSSDNGHATITIDDYGGSGVDLVVAFTGSGISVVGDAFAGGTFDSVTLSLGGFPVVTESYGTQQPGYAVFNNLFDLLDGAPSQVDLLDAFAGAFYLEPTTVNGSADAEVIYASTTFATTINAGGGADTIYSNQNDDSITAGAGADTIVASRGVDVIADFVHGTDTIDVSGYGIATFAQLQSLIDTGNTTDTVINFDGANQLTLAGVDQTSLDSGDFIYAAPTTPGSLLDGDGTDQTLNGGADDDTINGNGGVDNINGNDGNDLLTAGDGVVQGDGYVRGSVIDGGRGNDTIQGGSGDDYIRISAGDDSVDGGDSSDTLAFDDVHVGNRIDAVFSGASSGTITGTYDSFAALPIDQLVDTTFTSVSYVRGSSGNDTFTADAGASADDGSNGFDMHDENDNNNNVHIDALRVTGGAGNDTVTDDSGAAYGIFVVDYQQEQWTHDTYDGNHQFGTVAGENGVVVTMDSVGGGTASDTFLDTDTFTGVQAFRLTDAADQFQASANGGTQYYVEGRDGNDTIIGGQGADKLRGGDGNDSIVGGGERDDLNGDAGNDTLIATGGHDYGNGDYQGAWLRGGAGNDSVVGGVAADYFVGGSGADTITGGAGQDEIAYELENDVDHGGDNVHVTFSGEANGTITGNYGDGATINSTFTSVERVRGTGGNDSFVASLGTTVSTDGPDFYLSNPANPDQDGQRHSIHVTGGEGADSFTDNTTGFGGVLKVNYQEEKWTHADYNGDHEWGSLPGETGVVVNMSGAVAAGLASHTATDTFGDTDTISGNIHAFNLTEAADAFYAGDEGYSLNMSDGADTFVGGAGWDNVDGGNGNDSLDGGDGRDWLGGRGGDDTINGGAGDDDINGGPGADVIDGGAGWDNLNYDDDRDQDGNTSDRGVIVNLSDDSLVGVTAENQATGLTVAAHEALDTWGTTDSVVNIESINGTQFGDYMVAGPGDVGFNGNDGDDTLLGGQGYNNLDGGSGNDSLVSGGGDGWIGGWTGNDTLDATAGGHVDLSAGGGNDLVLGGGGDNYIGSGGGTDTTHGGFGWDEISFNSSESSVSSISFDVTGTGSGTIDGNYDDTEGGGANSGSVNGSTFDGIEVLVGSNGADTFEVESGAGGTSDGEVAFWNKRDFLTGDRAIGLVGGAGNDTFTDNSGRAGGASVIDYDEEKWNHHSYRDGYHDWGTQSGEEGVIVNLSGSQQTGVLALSGSHTVAAGEALDTFGDTDTIVGVQAFRLTDADDTFFAGDDAYGYEADGRGGNDSLVGGAGADLLIGDQGDDSLTGGAGADLLGGGDGNDSILGGTGDDRLYGDNGSDTFVGGDGADTIDGGEGWDILDYSNEAGSAGVTVNLATGKATDTFGKTDHVSSIEELRGTAQADTLVGDGHENIFLGGAGDDTITGNGSDGDNGDRAVYFTSTAGVIVNLDNVAHGAVAAGTASDGLGGTDTLIDISAVGGSNLGDTIFGGAADNWIMGAGGNDSITAGGGSDTVSYRDTNAGVIVNLSTTAHTVAAAHATDGHGFTDIFADATAVEAVEGSFGADQIWAGATALTMRGFAGNDSLTGGAGRDTADYSQDGNWGGGDGIKVNLSASATTLFGSSLASNRIVDGFGNTDVLSGVEDVRGTDNDDQFLGSTGANKLEGLGGNDHFYADAGSDTLDGGDGIDQIDFSQVTTTVAGGVAVNLTAGFDTIPAGSFAGTDTLIGIEEVVGTSKADNITGTDNPDNNWYDNGLWGLAGADTLAGAGGFDIAYYDQDASHGGARGVIVNLGSGSQSIDLATRTATGQTATSSVASGRIIDGFGTIDVVSGIEGIQGTNHADIFFGNAAETAANFWQGLGGNDTINGTAAFDIADYTKDDEHGGSRGVIVNLSGSTVTGINGVTGQGSNVSIAGGNALDGFGNTDTLANIDAVRGTQYDDIIIGQGGTSGGEYLQGLAGNDTIVGGANVYAAYDNDGNYGADGSGVRVDLAAGTATDDFQNGSGDHGVDTLTDVDNVIGSQDGDWIKGNAQANNIQGGGGNDLIVGSLGSDTVHGGSGGGAWFDQLNFSTASGGSLAFVFDGDNSGTVTGTVTIDGESGTVDTAFTDIEHVSGGQGNDTFTVAGTYVPSPEASRIVAEPFMDASGGDGADSFIDNSTVLGGTLLVSYDGDTRDRIDDGHVWGTRPGEHGVIVNLSGGDKVEGIDFSSDAVGSGATIAAGTAADTYGATDTFSGVHQVWLTTADDVFYAPDSAEFGAFANGSLGDDLLVGGNGTDFLVGGEGNDTIDGGDGVDSIAYSFDPQSEESSASGVIVNLKSSGDVIANGHTVAAGTALDDFGDTDTLSDIESIYGTSHDDIVYGNDAVGSSLAGGAGDDLLVGGSADDTLVGDIGDDTLDGGLGTHDTVDYGHELVDNDTSWPINGPGADRSGVIVNLSADTIAVGGHTLAAGTAIDSFGTIDTLIGIEQVTGTEFDDILFGGNGDTLEGGDGNDSLVSDSGADVMLGDGGNDTLVGGGGDDAMTGGAGDDSLVISDVTGTVVITDFVQGEDKIDISAFTGFTPGAAPVVTEDAGDALIDLGGGVTVRLTGLGATTFTDADFTFHAITGSGTINGTEGDDFMVGSAGPDTLNALGGNDTLNGGTGNDALNGGLGDDTYIIDAAGTKTITELAGQGTDTIISSFTVSLLANNVENLTLATGAGDISGTGNTLANVIAGNDGNNVLNGGNGNDTLNGGTGNDTLAGGANNDTYIVDSLGTKTIVEAAGAGTDTLVSSFTVATLAANVENLTLAAGAGSIGGTGNTLANVITGNEGDNSLVGAGGNDTLDGGAGIDTLVGGAGNDIYVVDDAAEQTLISEAPAGGIDRVESSVTFSLASLTFIENLTLTGGASDGTGNGLNNTITGTAGANSLDGAGGNDSLVGNAGNDTLVSGDGADTLNGGDDDDVYVVNGNGTKTIVDSAGTDRVESALTFSLASLSFIEDLTLTGTGNVNGTGNALANVITGNAGDNSLNGGTGADTMAGGAGNDIYVVDNAGDAIDESSNSGAGTDTIQSSISFDLNSLLIAGAVENLTLTSTSAANGVGTGNALANVITGTIGNNTLIGGAGDDTINGGGGNDSLSGGDDNDSVSGGAGNDTIVGGLGNDTLVTGAGTDSLDGGDGDDVYVLNGTGTKTIVDSSGIDRVETSVTYTLADGLEDLTLTGTGAINGTGNASDNTILGNTGSNNLSGLDGNDSIVGGGGNDTINGGSDTAGDTMIGGLGNDTYFVDSANDTVEDSGGIDLVSSSVDFDLSGGQVVIGSIIEKLTLTGTATFATGNSVANTLTGTNAANTIDGGAGNDTMIGLGGDDTYVVDSSGDVVTEAAGGGTDTVNITGTATTYTLGANIENLVVETTGAFNAIGNTLANVISGNDDGDTLNGGTGVDTLNGGLGDDTYVVDNAADVISDTGGANDTVSSSISYTLANGNGIENLVLTGTAALGTGNELDNTITGNASANTLNGGIGVDTLVGGLGNDTYIVDGTNDVVTEGVGAGTDTVTFNGASGVYVLGDNIERLTLGGTAAIDGTGNALANVITGNSASNVIDGGLGNDTMVGLAGNDTYFANVTADVITEAVGGGTDTVHFTGTSGTYTLGANVENLVLDGGAVNTNGTGSAVDNLMVGNDGDNVLNGLGGNDTLDGGAAGSDTLIGGAGNDTYIVRHNGDVVNESLSSGAGVDMVQSYITFSLADSTHAVGTVENLTLLGTDAIDATGNAAANQLIGNAGANSIAGGAGDDLIFGGDGNDSLDGGLGHDMLFGGNDSDAFVYSDADFGGSTGTAAANSDSLFDLTSLDHFDLTGLISTDDITLAGGDVNDAIRLTGSDGAFVIEINEGAVLHTSASADWSTAFNVYGSDLTDVHITVGDGAGTVYHYDALSQSFVV